MARGQKINNETARVTAEMAERIVAAALAHPAFGAVRLARLLGDEGVSVSHSLVYRTLRGRGLQNRKLRIRFLEEQARLEMPAGEGESGQAPEPPGKLLPERAFESPQSLVQAGGYPEAPAPTPAKKRPEFPTDFVPGHIVANAGASIITKFEHAGRGKEKWLFRGVDLLLAAFMVFLGIKIGTSLYDAWQQPIVAAITSPAPQPAPVAGEAAETNHPSSDYHVIMDRNLFGSASNPAPDAAREAADIEAIGLAGNEVGLKLIGTAVSKDRRLNYAVLEIAKTRSQEICREKDTVANVRIKRILRNNVIILTASGEKRLSVDEKNPAGTAASLVQPAAAATNFSGVPQVDPETKEMTHEISHDEIARNLPNLHQMLEDSNGSANVTEDKPDGFSIGRLRSRDALFRIGLRPGDVIKSVDGKAVKSMDDAEFLIDRLFEGGDFSILVDRGGQLQSLNLSIR